MTGVAGMRVVVTGAASGIGAATVARLVADGASAVIVDRDVAGGEARAAELGAGFVAADVADPVALTGAFERAAALLGGLDGVVNNAGIGNLKPLDRYSDREFDLVVRVNLYGTFHGIRAAVPLLSDGGSIVNMASVSGVRPTRGEGPYSAAKAGVIALSASAALEFGPRIRVNCVSPGFVRTPLNEMVAGDDALRGELEAGTPAGRLGDATEVASVIAFLLSPDASYVTGQNLVIDGGSVLPSKQVDDVLRRLGG